MLTLAFDVVVLGVLLRSRPAWAGWPTGPAVQGVAVAGTLLALSVTAATAHYGSLTAALAATRGEPAALTPETLALGPVRAGETVEQSLRVANLSADDLQVALAESNCGCVAVRGLPVRVAAGGWADIPVAVTVSATPGPFRRAARLRTSAGDLTYAVTAVVTAGPREPGTPPGPDAREVRP